jgi:NAD(P)-dependent dehydrogenase (short-subunit alcohol dehydrogenase family)
VPSRLANKVAIITGAGAGIGEATARLFAEEGATVALADIDEKAVAKVAAEINQNNGKAISIRADIARDAEAKSISDECVKAFGKIDILVNNAAVFVLKGVDATIDDWNRSLSVNVIGTSRVSSHAVKHMKANAGGAIVNMGSVSSFIAQPEFLTYSATKATILQMTKNMALDLAPHNIRVNCVCPGTILTKAVTEFLDSTGTSMEDFLKAESPKYLLNRVGKPSEVAPAILFLASDEASFITGTHLMVDGGYLAM